MALFAQALINGITDGVFLAMMALGITLVFGVARFPNVAHGDFLTVGAYGASTVSDCRHWAKQIDRAVNDSLDWRSRIRRYFTQWR